MYLDLYQFLYHHGVSLLACCVSASDFSVSIYILVCVLVLVPGYWQGHILIKVYLPAHKQHIQIQKHLPACSSLTLKQIKDKTGQTRIPYVIEDIVN